MDSAWHEKTIEMTADRQTRANAAQMPVLEFATTPFRTPPPRALYCEFPFGRPLGRPNDPAFQRRVIMAAFALLERGAGAVLEDFPERISDATDEPLACSLPPPVSTGEPSVVEEARALRSAYERQRVATGRTSVGLTTDTDGIPDLLKIFLKMKDGVPPEGAALNADPHRAALDVRAYCEEAALALADHVPEARAAESWFFDTVVPRGQE